MTRQLLISTALFLFVFELSAQQNGTKRTVVNAYESMTDASRLFEETELRKKMKEDGLTEPVIDKLIEERKKLQAQGRVVNWSNYSKSGVNPVPNVSCSDMGVETGWGTWQAATGTNSGGNPGTIGTPTVPVAPQFSITTGNGVDPCTPGAAPGSPTLPVVAPGFGNSSILLGEQQMTGCQVEQLTYALNVSAADTNFIFSYALVFYDPSSGHAPNEAPYAEFIILDSNGDTVPCSYHKFISSSFTPGFYAANNSCLGGASVYYKPWTTSGVSLVPYVGQTLTIKITNADCIYCGHYAHSYWDFNCGNNLVDFCSSTPVTLCSPADTSINNTYQWSLGNNIISGAVSACYTVTPSHSDTISVWTYNSVSKCGFYSSFTMNDTCLTGIEENNLSQALSLYPSPASQNIFLDFSGTNLGEAQVSISNILGEELYSTIIPASGKQMLDVSGYTEGFYFVNIRTGSDSATRKIIISR